MTAEERQALLHAYLDGETTPKETQFVEAELESDAEYRAEFEGLKAMSAALRAPIEAEMSQVDLSGLWPAIEKEIQVAEPVRQVIVDPAPTFMERIQEFFTLRQVAYIAAVALISIVGVRFLNGVSGDMEPGAGTMEPTVASVDETKQDTNQGVSDSLNESNLAFVSGLEYESGTVFVDQDPEDPTAPLIVWHIEDDMGDSQGG